MSANQYVTLVSGGGTPVRLADQSGAPYPTTGSGALVFANGPTIDNPIFTGTPVFDITNLNIPGDLTVGGDITASGDVAISGTLTVDGGVVGASIVVDSTAVLGGLPAGLLYNNSGILGTLAQSLFASVQGALVAGNVPIINDAGTGIKDSGVLLLTSLPANSVWGNITGSTFAPAAVTNLVLGTGGSLGTPTYSSALDSTSGIYFPASGQVGVETGGKLLVKFGVVGASSNSILIQANNTPTISAVGSGVALALAGGTSQSEVDLCTNGSSSVFLARFTTQGVGAPVNYTRFSAGVASTAVKWEATGTDTNINIQIATAGSGLLQLTNAGNFAANGAVATSTDEHWSNRLTYNGTEMAGDQGRRS